MREQLALPHTHLSLDVAVVDEAARHVLREHADHTRRAYAAPWQSWCDYCAGFGVAPSPVDPAALIVHLTELSMRGRPPTWRPLAPASVRLALAAISHHDARLRITPEERDPLPIASDPLVRAWHRGWTRDNPRAPRNKAPAVSPSDLERVIRAAQERPRNVSPSAHVAAYARDRAMLLLGVTAALRVSELVALEMADVTPYERGIRVDVRKAKNDPEGKGHMRGVMPGGITLRCPVDAVLAWMRIRGDHPGALFVAIGRDGERGCEPLDESSARRIMVRRAKAAGIRLTSHSLRASFITTGTEKGKALVALAEQGNWRSLDVLRGYVRQGELFSEHNPSAGLLDD